MQINGEVLFPDGSHAPARLVLEHFIKSPADLNALRIAMTAQGAPGALGTAWVCFRLRVWYKPWTWFGSRWRGADE
jgi:hypothetical protein